MANRYAVATGNWNATGTWSDSDGGAPGSTAPTASDAVFLTATSGAITVTVSATAACASLDATGFTGTLGFNAYTLTSTSSVTLGAGMTLSGATGVLRINGGTLTSNGISTDLGTLSVGGAVTLATNGTTWTSVLFVSSNTYTLSSHFQATGMVFYGISTATFAGAYDITVGTLVGAVAGLTVTFVSGRTVTVTDALQLGVASATITVKSSTASSSVALTYSGLAANAVVTRGIFTDVDASGGTAIDNWYGGTLTRTSGITNRTIADIGGSSGAGAWAHRMIGGGF